MSWCVVSLGWSARDTQDSSVAQGRKDGEEEGDAQEGALNAATAELQPASVQAHDAHDRPEESSPVVHRAHGVEPEVMVDPTSRFSVHGGLSPFCVPTHLFVRKLYS